MAAGSEYVGTTLPDVKRHGQGTLAIGSSDVSYTPAQIPPELGRQPDYQAELRNRRFDDLVAQAQGQNVQQPEPYVGGQFKPSQTPAGNPNLIKGPGTELG